ncbi:MAG: DNA recombination protein RmuC [Gammaproteobacteria bacterium]|nr:DNA recombination protein RmuC [Gammaproteobacteria bacterium]
MEAIKNTDLILIVAGLAGLLLLVLLYSLRQYQVANRELRLKLEADRQSEIELRDALHESEKFAQGLQMELIQERKLVAQKIEQFEANRKQLKLEFENLANKILEDKSRSFDQTNKKSIESLLKPFREQVESFQKRINDVHSESIKGNAALESEIKKVLEVGLKIGGDAQNLTDALKGSSQKRGSWGETQLEKTLQISGLIEHDHYDKQTSMQDAEGKRKQTDFLIKLPDDKHIVIDSKVSLAAYDRAVAAESDEQLELALAEHVKAVKRHIDDLQSKDYSNLAGIRSPSFVLMFMPIEPAYIEALKYEKDLFSYGYERGIVLVSHTTLIPILRTVANLWSMERSTREARELGDKAGDIYNQVRKVAERLARIGGSLGAATNHYNETVRALSGRQGLRGKVERFAEMSSKVTQAIPEIEPLHNDLQSESLELLAEPLTPEIEPDAADDEATDHLKKPH